MYNDDYDLEAIYEAQEDLALAAEQAMEELKESVRAGGHIEDEIPRLARIHGLREEDLRAAAEDWAGDSVTW